MTSPWMSPVTLERLAAALLHFIWQGAAIALVAALFLRLLRGRSAESRYAVASTALIAMLMAPLVTFAFHVETGALTLRVLRGFDEITQAASDAAAADIAGWTQRIVLVWMIGVALLLIRLLGGWLLSRRLVRTATAVVVPVVTEALQRARAGLNFHGAVQVLSGPRVETPMVIGWLRPAILLPASALTGLSADQLLAIVAHELAHVRRHDFLVNGLQRVVECVFFYHPAVWWVSGRIRVERERCCDDLAVHVCGDRLVYAQALVAIEKARAVVPALAVPSAGTGVAERVRRILGVHGAGHDWQSAAAAVLFAAILVSVGTWQPPMLATSSPAGAGAAAPSGPIQQAPVTSSAATIPASLASAAPASTASAPLGTLIAIATAQSTRTAAPADDAQPAAAPKVTPPAITASREAAREKLGLLRVEYSADSFVKQAAEGDTIAVRTFLAAGMHINARGDAGFTAMLKATEAGQLETVQALLAAGADPNLIGGPGRSSALSIAAYKGDLPLMQVLLRGGAQVDLKVGAYEETALIQAAHNGQRAAVGLLLDNNAFIDAQTTTSLTVGTALGAATSAGRIDVVRALLDRGADVNVRFAGSGRTALFNAADRPDVELLQLLLERGADVNVRSTDGSSPLLKMLPRGAKASPSALLFIQRGADANAMSEEGETPLTIATSRRMPDVVRALLDKGADPNRVKPGLQSVPGPPLQIALADPPNREAVEIAMLLIERGADVNARDRRGSTPLIQALQFKQDGVVRALLSKGADPNLVNSNGRTPLQAAGSNQEMQKLLMDAGARP